MENVLPRYKRPVASIATPITKVEHWDKALNAFDEGQFKQSIIEVINYINPNLLKDKDLSGTIEIHQSQGSAEINVLITNETFSVRAPFLKITEATNRVALLRKVAEVNFSPLKLEQIHLKNNELWFEYEMPIELSQPNKVYDLLRNVSVYADDYDDMFNEKYKTTFYKEATHTALNESEQDLVWSQISNIFEDYSNYVQYFKEKRLDAFLWDNLVISILKLSNMPYLNGKLRSDLEEYVVNLFDSNIDFNFRVDRSTSFMKKLIVKSREDIMKNVYHAEQFISIRWRSSPQIITDRLAASIDQVEAYKKEGSTFNLSYYLQFTLLKLIFDYTLEENYRNAIEQVLEDVTGLDPDDAAPILTKAFYNLHSGQVNNVGTASNKEPKKKGFFASLFS